MWNKNLRNRYQFFTQSLPGFYAIVAGKIRVYQAVGNGLYSHSLGYVIGIDRRMNRAATTCALHPL